MALLPPWFLDTVVAIGRLDEASSVPTANATGTLIGWHVGPNDEGENLYRVFLVTNRHVAEGKKDFFVRFNQGAASQWFRVELEDSAGNALWHAHPDNQCDIAAVSLNPEALVDAGADFRFFPSDAIWAYQDDVAESGIAAGDGVFVLGFPLGLAGTEKSYAIVRGGVLARWDKEIVGERKCFLIDANIFPGNSGGPVVVRPSVSSISGTKPVENAWLIGIVSGYLPYSDVAVSQQTGDPRMVLVENSGLASVVPLDFLRDLIEPLVLETTEDPVQGDEEREGVDGTE